jgi:hypothetical protein
LSVIIIFSRARVKSGLRIIGIEPNVDKKWTITEDFNPRRTHATITAVRKYDPKFQQQKRLVIAKYLISMDAFN